MDGAAHMKLYRVRGTMTGKYAYVLATGPLEAYKQVASTWNAAMKDEDRLDGKIYVEEEQFYIESEPIKEQP